jgi:hypothetical protein
MSDNKTYCRTVGELVTVVSLPHQCDNWSVGIRDDVVALIADLQKLVEQM